MSSIPEGVRGTHDSHANLGLVLAQVGLGLVRSGYMTMLESHPHGSARLGDGPSEVFDLVERMRPPFGTGGQRTRELVHEDGPGESTSAGQGALLSWDRDVVADDDEADLVRLGRGLLSLPVFASGEVRGGPTFVGKSELEDVSRIILDDDQRPATPPCEVQPCEGVLDLARVRTRKDLPTDGAREHPLADKGGMGGFVTASASAEQVNAVRGGLAEDEGGAVDDFGVRVEETESCQRIRDGRLGFVDWVGGLVSSMMLPRSCLVRTGELTDVFCEIKSAEEAERDQQLRGLDSL